MSKRPGLRLHRETVRELDSASLGQAAGGVSLITCFAGCPPTSIIVTEVLLRYVESQLGECTLATC